MATFRKRGSNWQVQVRVQGQNAISRSFTFKTDAERWAREAEASIERNDFQSPAKELQTVSLDEKLERYERVVTAKKERERVGSIQTNRSKKVKIPFLEPSGLVIAWLVPSRTMNILSPFSYVVTE
jgi:hypothetical protein